MTTTRLLASLGSAVALAFACTAQAQNPNRVPGQPFLNGVNVPWNTFGMDFGTHPSWGAGYNATWWNTTFADLKAYKVNTARVWLHIDGRASPEFNSSGDVTGLDSNLIGNLQDMLDKANANSIKVQLVLWSFDMGKDLTSSAGAYAGLHGNLITNTSYRTNYINKALNPILDGIKDKPALFCIEVINEPEWMISDNPDANQPNEVTKDQMRSFVQALRDAIKAKKSSLLVTVGAASVKWASANGGGPGDWWSGLGLDYYDIHYYDWQNPWHDPFANGKTPAYYGFEGKAGVIGEFGGNGNTPYSTVSDMYDRAWNNGYAGLMAWSYKGVDSEGTWNDFKSVALNFANNRNLGGATPTPTPTPTPAGTNNVTVQAEAGTLTGCSTATALAGYQGSGYVNGTTFDVSGDKVTVTVNQATAGNRTIRIRFAAPYGEKYQDVYVNGVFRGNVQFPSSTTWTTKDLTAIPMNAGNNTIEIRCSWGWIHIDSIQVF
ncbi:CBM35 domain-containing protein [Nibricoccus sp. IMCC34717]|uniref:CBM35 domain-containing protein n=1 Tax=Nibricoccus sp. IMCC34717 TaxID=3034021 RepID=UPI00384CCB51